MLNLTRICGFDTETTGVDVYSDDVRIVTAAFVYEEGDVSKDIELEMNPEIEIPKGASDVHGITTEKAQGFMPYLDGLGKMKEFFDWVLYEEIPIVAYNGGFDITLTKIEFERNGIPLDLSNLVLLDPIIMDRYLEPYRKGGRKLGRVAELNGYSLENAHNATADVYAVNHIVHEMLPKFVNKIEKDFGQRPDTWKDIMELQTILYCNQMTDLEKYFRRSDPNKTINKSWPIQDREIN